MYKAFVLVIISRPYAREKVGAVSGTHGELGNKDASVADVFRLPEEPAVLIHGFHVGQAAAARTADRSLVTPPDEYILSTRCRLPVSQFAMSRRGKIVVGIPVKSAIGGLAGPRGTVGEAAPAVARIFLDPDPRL